MSHSRTRDRETNSECRYRLFQRGLEVSMTPCSLATGALIGLTYTKGAPLLPILTLSLFTDVACMISSAQMNVSWNAEQCPDDDKVSTARNDR